MEVVSHHDESQNIVVSVISPHWVVEQPRRKGRRKVLEGFSKVRQIYTSE